MLVTKFTKYKPSFTVKYNFFKIQNRSLNCTKYICVVYICLNSLHSPPRGVHCSPIWKYTYLLILYVYPSTDLPQILIGKLFLGWFMNSKLRILTFWGGKIQAKLVYHIILSFGIRKTIKLFYFSKVLKNSSWSLKSFHGKTPYRNICSNCSISKVYQTQIML